VADARSRWAIYDRPLIAALYEIEIRLNSRYLWGASLSRQADFMADVLDSAEGSVVLDVPGGNGTVVAMALPRMRRVPTRIVLADMSVAMLGRARRRLGERAVCVRADVDQLPFRDAAFRAIHSGNGFHVFADRDAAAHELARVTTDGGVAGITTWTRRGRRVAEAYMALLHRAGSIGSPETVEHHSERFVASGFAEERSDVSGSLLLWRGRRAGEE
jgi:ubiquinone/menaquinone biosynthesis C-methylase UbiE